MHAAWCFDVLQAHFENREPVDPPFDNPDEPYALFVTWETTSHLRSNKKPSLRGCIGTFSPLPLAQGLREYALIAALQDHRFSPIRESELPTLICGVSLLTPMTPISDPLGWTPGVHGIHISFPHPSTHPYSPSSLLSHTTGHGARSLSATYLPEVCLDQGWTREECVKSAIQKAGYRGKVEVGDKVWKSLKVKVYGSVKGKCTWDEYRVGLGAGK